MRRDVEVVKGVEDENEMGSKKLKIVSSFGI